MRLAIRIVTWYGFLVAPMIAVLYSDEAYLSGAMAIFAFVLISVIGARNIFQLARESDALKKDIVSHVSHELKAPLAAMQETTSLLLQRLPGPLTDKQQRLLQLNLESGKRLTSMIGHLMDLSCVEAGVADYEMKPHDLTEIARKVIEEIRPRAAERSLRIVAEIPKDPLIVSCDPTRMTQILANLVDNAIRFSPKGGTISLSVSSNDQSVLLSVRDSGSGIQDVHKEAVFKIFHRVQRGRKSEGQRLGVGLAVTQALVTAHHGKIWVEDNPSGGSIFHAQFPNYFVRQTQKAV